ncbi:MAG: extracellular solute-binding protein [Neomegalonema sp.]|nr:extracellular solute-binding protein [Neomegalonema sp.]
MSAAVIKPVQWIGRAAASVSFAIAMSVAALAPAAAEEPKTTISHGISAFGDLKYPADFKQFDYVYIGASRAGGVILEPVIATQTFDTFNPYTILGDSADGAQYQFDSLMARAIDEPDAVYGLVAKSVEMPADRSFAVFRLRPEARFADGSALTAADVAWSVETLKTKGAPQYRAVLSAVTKISVPDPMTIRFDFAASDGRRDMAAFVGRLPIFSKAWYAKHDFEKPSLTPPLASGPYKVGKFEGGRFVRYDRRDDYWAKDLPVRRGMFNFASITYQYHASRDLSLELFKAGSYDFREEFSSKNWATRYDFPARKDGLVKREVLKDGAPSGAQGWWFNTRRKKFADRRVRKALAMVYDFEEANKQLFYGLYRRTVSPFANSDFVASGAPTAAELALMEPFRGKIPEAAFGAAPTPPVLGGRRALRKVLRKARALLREAGWAVDPKDGLLKNASGEVFEIEFLDRTGSTFDRIVRPYIKNLERLGVRATYRDVDFVQYEERRRKFDYDVITGRFTFLPTLGPRVRGLFHSDTADKIGAYNLAGVASPALDAMIAAMAKAKTRAELITAARVFDRIFRAEHYWTPHWFKAAHNVAYWDRFGRPMDHGLTKPAFDRAVILTWWIDPEKAAKLKSKLGR